MTSDRARRRHGATAVEAAICFPILFVLVCMIFQLGHIYFVRNQLQIAARDAVRYGATDGVSSLEAKARIMEVMAPIILGHPMKVSVEGDQLKLSPPGGDPLQGTEAETALSAFNDRLEILVKDAAIYDTGGPYPQSEAEILALPDGELSEMDPRHLFTIRAEVKYKTPFRVPGIDGARFSKTPLFSGVLNMSTYAFSRHE